MNGVFQMFNSLKIKSLTTKMKKLVAKKDYYKTIDCANEILDLDENNLLALKIKSDALRQLGDFEGALECANIIVDLEPTSFNLSNQAVLLYFLGNVDDSFGILDNVLKNHADFKEAFNTKFTFLCELERYDEALELCDFALEKDSKFLDAFALKSKVYFDKGDYKKSIEYADQMLKLDENNLYALKSKSNSLCALENYNGALECANIFADLEPNSTNRSYKATLLYFSDDIDGSFEILDDILMNSTDIGDAFNNKSIILCELGRFDEALELCDFALDKGVDYFDVLCMKIKIYSDKKDYARALEYVNEAYEINPNDDLVKNMESEILDKLNE